MRPPVNEINASHTATTALSMHCNIIQGTIAQGIIRDTQPQCQTSTRASTHKAFVHHTASIDLDMPVSIHPGSTESTHRSVDAPALVVSRRNSPRSRRARTHSNGGRRRRGGTQYCTNVTLHPSHTPCHTVNGTHPLAHHTRYTPLSHYTRHTPLVTMQMAHIPWHIAPATPHCHITPFTILAHESKSMQLSHYHVAHERKTTV